MNLSSVSGHNRPTGSAPAVLLYDATCRFCTASGKRTVAFMPRGSVVLRDINDPAAQARYGVTPEAAARDMHLVTRRGTLLVGADAVRGLLHLTRWGRPLSYLWLVPGFGWAAGSLYSWVASHRYLLMGKTSPSEVGCENGACSIYLHGKSTE